MPLIFEDFELTVDGLAGSHQVEVRGPGGIRLGPMVAIWQPTKPVVQALERLQQGELPVGQVVQEIGATLFETLFPPPIRQIFAHVQGSGNWVRLRLCIRAPDLAHLPWELLYDPQEKDFLALFRTRPLVRTLHNGIRRVAPLKVEGPLHLLHIQANPRDLPALDQEKSERSLVETIGSLGREVEITCLRDATPAHLRGVLNPASPYHILHYDGHALFDKQGQSGFLALQDEAGDSHPFSGKELRHCLEGTRVRLVVLAACKTGTAPTQQNFGGIIGHLMQASDLPAVVAMQAAISDSAAIAFNRGFYQALALGYPVDVAVVEGRLAMRGILDDESNSSAIPEWAVPLLMMRGASGELFDSMLEVTGPIARQSASYPRLNPPDDGRPVGESNSSPEKNTISPQIFIKLRQILIECGPLKSHVQLRSVFAHPLLRPWRDHLPETSSIADRVDTLCEFLCDQKDGSGQSALVIFLRVLTEYAHPATECYHKLTNLVSEIEA